MLLRSLFFKTLRDLRGQILGWGLGMGSLALMIVLLFPAFKDQMGIYAQMLSGYPKALTAFFGDIGNIGTFSGWLTVEFFTWVPPILAIFAVSAGTGLIAGEEERGTLDLLLSQPIRRWRVVIEKAAALAVAAVSVCLLAGLCLVGAAATIGETAALDRLMLASLDIAPVTLAGGTLALMASVLFRRRRLATAIAIVVTIGSYFVESLGRVVNVLEPYRPFTLFHYYKGGSILTGAADWGGAGILLGLALLCVAISVVAFQRRDIGV